MSQGFAIDQATFPRLSCRAAICHKEKRVYLGGHHSLVQICKNAPMEYFFGSGSFAL